MKKKILSIGIALSLLFSMCMVMVSAEENYIPVDEVTYNGHTYQMFDEGLKWAEAQEYCKNIGGHLATVSSEEEQYTVVGLVEKGNKYQYWLGATDDSHEGQWQWVTGETWSYENWRSGQPDNENDNEHFLHVYGKCPSQYCGKIGEWNDMNEANYFEKDAGNFSTSTIGFICEWDYVRSSFGSEISEWASDEIEEAYDKELIPEILVGEDLTQPITRAEFAAVSVKAYELMANAEALPVVNNPFTDTKDVEVLKAYNAGITTGVSATEFAPDTLLNREQAATMLTRVFKRATMKDWTIETDAQFELNYNKPTAFADDNKISDWAKDSVYFMAANEIINGVGGNKFAPQNTTSEEEATGYANATREQALIIATRMVENLE